MTRVLSTADTGAAYLAHYGVMGMRWGVRKDKPKKTKRTVESRLQSMSKSLKEHSNKRGRASRDRIKNSWQNFIIFCRKHKRAARLLTAGGIIGLSVYITGAAYILALLKTTSSLLIKDFAGLWR